MSNHVTLAPCAPKFKIVGHASMSLQHRASASHANPLLVPSLSRLTFGDGLVKVRATNEKALGGGPQFSPGGKHGFHLLSTRISRFPPGKAFGGETNKLAMPSVHLYVRPLFRGPLIIN